MKKLVIEIPLTKQFRIDDLSGLARSILQLIKSELSTFTVGQERVHAPEEMTVRVESETLSRPRTRSALRLEEF